MFFCWLSSRVLRFQKLLTGRLAGKGEGSKVGMKRWKQVREDREGEAFEAVGKGGMMMDGVGTRSASANLRLRNSWHFQTFLPSDLPLPVESSSPTAGRSALTQHSSSSSSSSVPEDALGRMIKEVQWHLRRHVNLISPGRCQTLSSGWLADRHMDINIHNWSPVVWDLCWRRLGSADWCCSTNAEADLYFVAWSCSPPAQRSSCFHLSGPLVKETTFTCHWKKLGFTLGRETPRWGTYRNVMMSWELHKSNIHSSLKWLKWVVYNTSFR